jgi:2-polyprenyl-6-methoxyphenol hydroxylase-like FAD-dependent oxidoreductase
LHEVRSPQSFDLVWGKVPLPSFVSAGATVHAYIGNGHAVLCFPSYDGRLEFGWAIEKGSFGDLRKRGIDEWIDQMTEFGSPDLGAHLRAHRADVTHPLVLDVICDRLTKWSAPGLILLGDAGHPMTPAGGQGINIALRDALVAANHLCVAN